MEKVKIQRRRKGKPHFNLRNKNTKKRTPIFLFFKYHKEIPRLQYSTGESIQPEFWNINTHRVKDTTVISYDERESINDQLDRIAKFCKKVVLKTPRINNEEFKLLLDYELGFIEKPKKEAPTLFEFINSFVNAEKSKVDGKRGTWKKWEGVYNHLKVYAAEKDSEYLDYDDINWEFQRDFKNWLYSEPRSHSQNTASKIYETIIMFMREAHRRTYRNDEGDLVKYHYNEIPFDKNFKIKRVKTSRHPLTIDELRTLYDLDLSDNPKLDKVRDIFLISAYGGGLRYSDTTRIRPEHIIKQDGVEMIRLFTEKGDSQKRDNEVVIPFQPELKAILEKHNYRCPDPISSQKMNTYLKELCKHAKLDRAIIKKSSVAGQIETIDKKLWETVSIHTSRFSFITNMLSLGVDPVELQKVTGQSLAVLMGYERANKTANAVKVAKKVKLEREAIESSKMKVV